MEALVHWFSQNLSQYISPEGAVFIISMIPLLELRGGLLAASLLKISAAKGNSTVYCWKYYSYSVYSVVYQTDFQGFKKDETLSGTCYEIGRQGNEKK